MQLPCPLALSLLLCLWTATSAAGAAIDNAHATTTDVPDFIGINHIQVKLQQNRAVSAFLSRVTWSLAVLLCQRFSSVPHRRRAAN